MMRVLIADDENATSEGLRDFIPWNDLGISQIYIASDGIEALELTQRVKPDIIITDIRMPKMDGIQYIDKIKTLLPASKIIFMSAYSEKEYLKSAIKFNAVSYVEKPINPEEMIAAVKQAVRMVNSERGNPELTRSIALMLTEPAADLPDIVQDLSRINPDFLSSDHYCTLVVKTALPKAGVHKPSNEIDTLREVFDKAFSAHLTTRVENGEIIIHVCDKSIISENTLRCSLQKTLSGINKSLNLQNGVFISVGRCVTGIENLWKSYKTAMEASSRFFFCGYGSIVFYDNENAPPAALDESRIDIFEKCLRLNDRSGAVETLESLSVYARQHQNIDIDSVRNLFFKMAMRITAVGIERNLPSGEIDSHDFIWKSIAGKETFYEIHNYLIQKAEAFFSFLENISIRKPVYRIIMYIEKNYTRKSLTINEIADSIHLTPAYICNLFNKETGKTINQYLNSYRIEKAKILLKSPRLKLADIASQTGYSDVNYFMRTFKKTTGITPSEYREKFLLQ